MNHHLTRTAAAAVAAVTLVSPTFTEAAPASAATALPRPATRVADIDGDGRADRVTLTTTARTRASQTLRLTVQTATRRTASARITVPLTAGTSLAPSAALQGTAEADGARGREILVRVSADGAPRSSRYRVYTWRQGRLAAMASVASRGSGWSWSRDAAGVDGYEVSGRGAQRRLVHRHVSLAGRAADGTPRFAGTATTYAWTSAGWSRRSVRRITGLTLAQVEAFSGCHGIVWE